MLIDIKYFTSGSRQIMNAVNCPANPNEKAVAARIDGYIVSLEDRFLRNMVGKDLAGEVSVHDVNGDVTVFRTVADKLRESFADYVHYHMLRDMNTTATITGGVQLKSGNTPVHLIVHQAAAWNRMVRNNEEFLEWVRSDECPLSIRVSKKMLTYINAINL